MTQTIAMTCQCGTVFYHQRYRDTRGRAFCSASCAAYAVDGDDPNSYWKKLEPQEKYDA